MNCHAIARVALVLATITLAACNAATVTPSPRPDPPSPVPTATPSTPSPTAQPQATAGTLPPDGSWQVELTADELVAAGWPADVTAPGTYTWTFGGRPGPARSRTGGRRSPSFARPEMDPLDERVSTRRTTLGVCGGRGRRHRLGARRGRPSS